MVDGLFNIGGEMQAAGGDIAADHLEEPRLVDGDTPFLQDTDLFRVDVDADDVIANFSQTGATDQTDITGTDDGDFHVISAKIVCKGCSSQKSTTRPALPVRARSRR